MCFVFLSLRVLIVFGWWMAGFCIFWQCFSILLRFYCPIFLALVTSIVAHRVAYKQFLHSLRVFEKCIPTDFGCFPESSPSVMRLGGVRYVLVFFEIPFKKNKNPPPQAKTKHETSLDEARQKQEQTRRPAARRSAVSRGPSGGWPHAGLPWAAVGAAGGGKPACGTPACGGPACFARGPYEFWVRFYYIPSLLLQFVWFYHITNDPGGPRNGLYIFWIQLIKCKRWVSCLYFIVFAGSYTGLDTPKAIEMDLEHLCKTCKHVCFYTCIYYCDAGAFFKFDEVSKVSCFCTFDDFMVPKIICFCTLLVYCAQGHLFLYISVFMMHKAMCFYTFLDVMMHKVECFVLSWTSWCTKSCVLYIPGHPDAQS